ncbi:MAG: NAD-dependent epimerase/dehydratase family protein [Acidaminococcaceae bacterium]|nr:NAD-dependent epimerase/dehydratase family protein [Acidaminococcaceae bacterium]
MKQMVLVTGAYGFIGRYVAKEYHENGYYVIGMGHGNWSPTDANLWGIDEFYNCDISIENLVKYAIDVDVIVHCAGSGSVGFSVENPLQDFERTVRTTYFVLEFIRKYSHNTKLIYSSSAAVYGISDKVLLEECSDLNPISPYGFHKKIVEDLCRMYVEQYSIKIVVLRLFSVYGNELKKQLLWDACKKIVGKNNLFYGTGKEKRDWIHVVDVARYFFVATQYVNEKFEIYNVASGHSTTVEDMLEILYFAYGTNQRPVFNGQVNSGNPMHYLADVNKIQDWNVKNKIHLSQGIKEYVRWFKNEEH